MVCMGPPDSHASDSSAPDPLGPDDRFLRALLRRMDVDAHLAEDIAQETWLATLRQPAATLQARRAWMGSVARNFVYQAFRTDRRRSARERAVARSEVDAPEIPDREALRRVREELDHLDERYRDVLRLRFYEDLPPTLIADRLEIPIETARTRLKRGLTALHARIIARRETASAPRSADPARPAAVRGGESRRVASAPRT